MEKYFTLDCIRINSEHELPDAIELASRILVRDSSSMDHATFEYSCDYFVAVAIAVARFGKPSGNMHDMLQFIEKAGWDDGRQMILFILGLLQDIPKLNDKVEPWIAGFQKKFSNLPDKAVNTLVERIRMHWLRAQGLPIAGIPLPDRPRNALPIFDMDAIARAIELAANMKEDRRAATDRPLRNAMVDDGYRCIPDTLRASLKLSATRADFENLAEPINRLSDDLVLAGAMKPEAFGITPILLLGDPGIGKTYLATQLAMALGVPSNKISAAGAQAAFQFTGSHSSWSGARPGSLFTTLADGDSAAPLMIIDELDKMPNGQYPVLPMLLDLLEHRTARRFKDEFYEVEFDASRLILVMTANELDTIPQPLLSRMEIFSIPRPAPAQRLRIICKEAETLRLATNRSIELDDRECAQLADRDDLDLRRLARVVKEGFARAIKQQDSVARLEIPNRAAVRRTIGFGAAMG